MFAGDLDSVIPSPAGNLPGIMMYSNNVTLNLSSDTADETTFSWKSYGRVAMRLSGEASTFVNMTDPTGIVYAATVRFEFKDAEVYYEF